MTKDEGYPKNAIIVEGRQKKPFWGITDHDGELVYLSLAHKSLDEAAKEANEVLKHVSRVRRMLKFHKD